MSGRGTSKAGSIALVATKIVIAQSNSAKTAIHHLLLVADFDLVTPSLV